MIAVVQRVRQARVTVATEEIGRIGPGAVVLVGFGAADEPGSPGIARLADRLIKLRMFDDARGRLNRSLADVGGAMLVVSQITLTARLDQGLRPGFDDAARPDAAREMYDELVKSLRSRGVDVQTGRFGAEMVVSIENDGPVTFVLEEPGGAAGRARGA